jgi:hypothetical protein
MMRLSLCASCERHVRSEDDRCPFCGSEARAPARRPGPVLPRSQLTRAAIFLGATALAAAPACGGGEEPDTVEEEEGGSGGEVAMYGAPPPDDGGEQGGEPPTDPDDDYGSMEPMYGVPPER